MRIKNNEKAKVKTQKSNISLHF